MHARAVPGDEGWVEPPSGDQVVYLHGISWEDYDRLLAMRGERRFPRMAYLDGTVELMSNSDLHEWVKKTLARLVEMYAFFTGNAVEGLGSWTMRKKAKQAGVEPDECYFIGPRRPGFVDLAIEVVNTAGAAHKLEIYRRLGVSEVWIWRRGRIHVQRLEGDRYVEEARSRLLPNAPLAELAEWATMESQTEAIERLRSWTESG